MASENVFRMLVFARRGQVKRIDMVIRGNGYFYERSAKGLRHVFVFVFRVDYENLGSEKDRAQNLQFYGVAFAAAGSPENDLIGVFQTEAVEQYQRIIMHVYPIKYSFILGQVVRNKGEARGDRFGIQGRVDPKIVFAKRQGGHEALFHAERGLHGHLAAWQRRSWGQLGPEYRTDLLELPLCFLRPDPG